ncbi:MAG: hypothetical protein K2X93_06695 [Candidatus Obscuribacterales bacterium]|nr:hypothetical protein [Candidatus Obscuribacterales bacterium]
MGTTMIRRSHTEKELGQTSMPVVSAEDMRVHMNYYEEESTEIDGLLDFFVSVAANRIEAITGRPLSTRTFTYKLQSWPRSEVVMLRAPVSEIVHVKYKEPNAGVLTTWSTDSYEVDMDSIPSTLRPKWGCSWPNLYPAYLPIEIEYKAGGTPPPELLLALKLLASTWFKNRAVLQSTRAEKLPEPAGFIGLLSSFVIQEFK